MEPVPTLARRFWAAIEPLHAVAYFDPVAIGTLEECGLRGFWMGYFAGRVAPLGPLGPEPVTAVVFGFSRARVARAIPDAWGRATPSEVLAARIDGSAAALATHLADRCTPRDLDTLADLLWHAIEGCSFDGRALAAGWSSVEPGADPFARIWLAATVLREHRGDGHVLGAVSLELRGLDTTVTHVATGAVERDRLQSTRGWTDDEWAAATRRLQARGILERDGRLTAPGVALRQELEMLTDRLAAGPVEHLGSAGVERAIALATPMSRHLIDTGVLPVPNPIGVPRP